jgi:hypothetical protein
VALILNISDKALTADIKSIVRMTNDAALEPILLLSPHTDAAICIKRNASNTAKAQETLKSSEVGVAR